MNSHSIRTEAEYEAALRAISSLVDSDPARGTPEGNRLDMLATLIQADEAQHFPMNPAAP